MILANGYLLVCPAGTWCWYIDLAGRSCVCVCSLYPSRYRRDIVRRHRRLFHESTGRQTSQWIAISREQVGSDMASPSSRLRNALRRILLLAFPANIRPSLGQRREWWQDISSVTVAHIRTGQIAQAKHLAIALLSRGTVNRILSKDH